MAMELEWFDQKSRAELKKANIGWFCIPELGNPESLYFRGAAQSSIVQIEGESKKQLETNESCNTVRFLTEDATLNLFRLDEGPRMFPIISHWTSSVVIGLPLSRCMKITGKCSKIWLSETWIDRLSTRPYDLCGKFFIDKSLAAGLLIKRGRTRLLQP